MNEKEFYQSQMREVMRIGRKKYEGYKPVQKKKEKSVFEAKQK